MSLFIFLLQLFYRTCEFKICNNVFTKMQKDSKNFISESVLPHQGYVY